MSARTRKLVFNKFGLKENPIGQHVVMPDGSLREVYDVYYREVPAAIMLRVRSFNREITEEIGACMADILDRSWYPFCPEHGHDFPCSQCEVAR